MSNVQENEFHPDRHAHLGELHGITVVLGGHSGKTYLGRWHQKTARGITLRNVAIHDPVAPDAQPLDQWLARQRKYGVEWQIDTMVLPLEEFNGAVTPLV